TIASPGCTRGPIQAASARSEPLGALIPVQGSSGSRKAANQSASPVVRRAGCDRLHPSARRSKNGKSDIVSVRATTYEGPITRCVIRSPVVGARVQLRSTVSSVREGGSGEEAALALCVREAPPDSPTRSAPPESRRRPVKEATTRKNANAASNATAITSSPEA